MVGLGVGHFAPYLEEKHQIDLMKSEELAAFLTNTTRATHFIFTPGQWT